MIDTASSRVKRRICGRASRGIKIMGIIDPEDPNRDISRCPAIILAVSRIAKVNGRIINLIDSIITIKGMSKAEVPWGVIVSRCIGH